MRNRRVIFFLSRLKGLLLAPGREWKVIHDERPGGAPLFRDFIVLPCVVLSILVILLRWATGDISSAIRWGIINFIACTVGCILTFRVTKALLASEVKRSTHVILQLVIYPFSVYLPFRSLSMGFPPREFIGDLMTVFSLYSFYTLYTGLRVLTTLEPARVQGSCFIIGLIAVSLPLIFTHLLAIILRVPIII